MRRIAPLLPLLLVVWGCQSSAFDEGDYKGQGMQIRYEVPRVPGVVVAVHEDGAVTTSPLTPAMSGGQPLTSLAPAPPRSPVVSVVVIPEQPGICESYTITPEQQEGDRVGSSRMMSWAGEAPSTVIKMIGTQKQKRTHNPLPAVIVDQDGIRVLAGGGSAEEQSGLSWWQRLWAWATNVSKSILFWILVPVIGLAVLYAIPATRSLAMGLINWIMAIPKKSVDAYNWVKASFDKWWATPPAKVTGAPPTEPPAPPL